MVKFYFGSGDSTDTDVVYIFDKMPELSFCKNFCSGDPNENKNIAVIENGIIKECYKGTPDELNNAIYYTYALHKQEYLLTIKKPVYRIKVVKIIRALRVILSHLSKSQYRHEIKKALKSDFDSRVDALRDINLVNIDYSCLNNKMSREDILKVIAFQIGQTIGLLDFRGQREYYTKTDIALDYPELKPFLCRNSNADINILEAYKNIFLDKITEVCSCLEHDPMMVTDGEYVYNLITEKGRKLNYEDVIQEKVYEFTKYVNKSILERLQSEFGYKIKKSE